MHEGVNFYGVNGSIGNSIVVGQTQSGFINALDILEMVNTRMAIILILLWKETHLLEV